MSGDELEEVEDDEDEDYDPYRVEDPFYDGDPPDDDPGVSSARRFYAARKLQGRR